MCLSFYELSGPCFIRIAVGSGDVVTQFGPITARISCLQPMIKKLDFGPIRKKSAKYDDDAVHLLGSLSIAILNVTSPTFFFGVFLTLLNSSLIR